MLSYRHMFHAGNFADVFKHALLTRLLLALNAKNKPYCYLDTHAGIGTYDLMHEWAQKAREFDAGIARLWGRKDIPAALKPYMDIVRAENPHGNLRHYPGSPQIARRLIRPGDRMVLTELNETDHTELKRVYSGDKQVAVHHLDGYQGLKAFLPPRERRGLVLIDSSFDRSREFHRIVTELTAAHERWATGMYAIWYPLMDPGAMIAFTRNVAASGIREILRIEITVRPPGEEGLVPGCGMLIVHPPWRFDIEIREVARWLAQALSADGKGRALTEWLVRE